MADYVAGRGTTALGIIGTVLGGLGTTGALMGGNPLWNNGAYPYGAYPYEASNATMHDIDDVKQMAEKDAEIAQLKAERTAHAVEDRAKEYSIEVYKDLAGRINEMKDAQNNKWTDQMVVNARMSDAITALDGKANNTANLVAQITRTAVPQAAICNFGNSCGCGCGNNV